MDQDEILLDCEDRMEKAVGVFQGQLQGLRTGRATPALVDSLRVEAYGAPTPLKQLANISVPEPQQIVIRPFNIPSLSTERRRQLVSRVKELAEEARVAIRNVRRDANKHAEQGEKQKLFSEDDRDLAKEEIQDLTKRFEGKVNDLASSKETEVMDE